MSVDKKHKNWLTPLLHWLNGEATRFDEQSLDALAKEDPFLADALEGYRLKSEGDHATAVTRLKAQLRQRSRQRRAVGFYLLRAAAFGVVLLAAWVVFRQFGSSEKTQVGMMESVQQIVESPSAEFAPPPVMEANESIAELRPDTVSHLPFLEKKSTTTSDETRRTAFSDQKTPAVPPAPASGTAVQVFTEENKVAADAAPEQVLAEKVVSQKKEPSASQLSAAEIAEEDTKTTAKRKEATNLLPADTGLNAQRKQARALVGQVTDESGEPLIGVNISVKGTSLGTVTDVNGQYTLEVPVGTSSLQFAYTGYTNLEVVLGYENRLDVQLAGSASLSEVIMPSGKAKSKKVVSAKPQGGFRKFEKYLEENMRRPDAAAAVKVSGLVHVRFRILSDGALTDFQPTGLLSQAFMDEAVRLLREGPKWKGEPGNIVVYSIQF